MKKPALVAIVIGFLLLINLQAIYAQTPQGGLVPCGQPGQPRCELSDLFQLALNIYNFIVWLSIPLAGLAIVIGGILLMVSAGNPGLAHAAKRIIWGTVIGIILVFTSWLIIRSVLWALGVTSNFIF